MRAARRLFCQCLVALLVAAMTMTSSSAPASAAKAARRGDYVSTSSDRRSINVCDHTNNARAVHGYYEVVDDGVWRRYKVSNYFGPGTCLKKASFKNLRITKIRVCIMNSASNGECSPWVNV